MSTHTCMKNITGVFCWTSCWKLLSLSFRLHVCSYGDQKHKETHRRPWRNQMRDFVFSDAFFYSHSTFVLQLSNALHIQLLSFKLTTNTGLGPWDITQVCVCAFVCSSQASISRFNNSLQGVIVPPKGNMHVCSKIPCYLVLGVQTGCSCPSHESLLFLPCAFHTEFIVEKWLTFLLCCKDNQWPSYPFSGPSQNATEDTKCWSFSVVFQWL